MTDREPPSLPAAPSDDGSDPYSRLEYRRLIAWPQRIEREWPFLEKVLASAPRRRLLDLGCGTGEHARFLASRGFEVVGVDRSESMLARARSEPAPPGVSFVSGDLADLQELVEGDFGAAICLGNTLPHLRSESALVSALSGLRRRLLPGGPLCLQILNYDKIFADRQRHLPLNFRREPDGWVVFLRLMEPREGGEVVFNPTSLKYRPGTASPVEVVASKNVVLHGWTGAELDRLLEAAGFGDRRRYGGMEEEPYQAESSPDLVVVAR